jgi:hypothetical protein
MRVATTRAPRLLFVIRRVFSNINRDSSPFWIGGLLFRDSLWCWFLFIRLWFSDILLRYLVFFVLIFFVIDDLLLINNQYTLPMLRKICKPQLCRRF